MPNYLRNLNYYLVKAASYVSGTLLFFSALAIRPVISVRFGFFDQKQIGHQISQFEYIDFMREVRTKTHKPTIFILSTEKPAANSFLYQEFRSHFFMGKEFFGATKARNLALRLGLNSFVFMRKQDRFFDPSNYAHTRAFNGPWKRAHQLSFEEKFVAETSLDRPLALIHSRDGRYKREQFVDFIPYAGGVEHAEEDHRNTSIDALIPTVKFLIDEGFSVVRVGKSVERAFPLTDKHFFDYATSSGRSDTRDIALFREAKLFVSASPSGVNELGRLLSVPTLFVNCAPLFVIPPVDELNVYLLRPHFHLTSRRVLNLSQVESMTRGLPTMLASDYTKQNIKLYENSPEDILDGVRDLIDYKLEKRLISLEAMTKQSKTWKILFSESYEDSQVSPMISPRFLRQNPWASQ